MEEDIFDGLMRVMVSLEEADQTGDKSLSMPLVEFVDRNTGAECALYNQDLSMFLVISTVVPDPSYLMMALSN